MTDQNIVSAWHQRMLSACQAKLQRPLTAGESHFILSRGGFIALEMMEETINSLPADQLADYLRSEISVQSSTKPSQRKDQIDLPLLSKYWRSLANAEVNFTTNLAIHTWCASHVWYVRDEIGHNQDAEHFLAKIYHSHPFSSFHPSEPAWEQRVDVATWLLSLEITSTDALFLKGIIGQASKDLQRSEDDGSLLEQANALLQSIKVPHSGWSIKEATTKRHPIGLTKAIVFESEAHYHFLEIHIES